MNMNFIHNNNDETIGYYNDLYDLFVGTITDMLGSRNLDGAKEQMEMLDEMSKYANYDGLLVLSMNNGMGFTVKPYKGE